MGKTINVKSDGQSGGVTAGEIKGDVTVDQSQVAETRRDIPVWLKCVGAVVTVLASIAALIIFFGG